MNYPLISEYIEAIKAAEENFEQLKNLRPVLDGNGEPMFSSGNFAVVFKMKDEQTGKLHAVKCFLKEQEGRAEAYRLIAEELEYFSSTFLTPIKYLDKELFVDTAQTTETEFPVLLMDWVEGQTLDSHLRYLIWRYQKAESEEKAGECLGYMYEMDMLAYQFSRLAMWLMPLPFAHGDLKPDNILVRKDGTLALVDYDGMYVPAMKGQRARELGSPDFRHPSRTEDVFDEHIDDFSLVSILLSLKAIALQPELLEQYGASDRLLFSANDYRNLSESQVMDALKTMMQDTELATLYSLFILSSAQNNLSQTSFRLLNLKRPKVPEYENLSTTVTDEDLANAWTDEFGVKYSKDRKRLLKAPGDIKNYQIIQGTKIICDEAFPNVIDINSDLVDSGNGVGVVDTEIWGSELSSIIIPDSITTIGVDAFSECEKIISLVIPHSVKAIGNCAFSHCSGLISIGFSEGLRDIGESAFARCSHLLSISLPDSVHSIGRAAFSGCSNLETINIPKNINELKDHTFWLCRKLLSVTIDSHILSFGNSVFKGCSSLKYIFIPSNSRKMYEEMIPEYKEILYEKVTVDKYIGISRIFSQKEIDNVYMAKIVQGQFSKMVCFYMNDGCQKYIPLVKDSILPIGDKVDLRKAKLIELSGEGIYYGAGPDGDYCSNYLVEA